MRVSKWFRRLNPSMGKAEALRGLKRVRENAAGTDSFTVAARYVAVSVGRRF
jgi:hypothetical protein